MSRESLDLTQDHNAQSGRSAEQALAVKAFIARFAKKDVSSEILGDYDIAPVCLPYEIPHGGTKGTSPNKIYIETPTGFELQHKRKLIAAITYEPVAGSALQVRQLQGAEGSTAALQPIKWERLLLASLIEYAKQVPGITEVWVPAARTLPFYHQALGLRRDRSKEEHQATMRLHYDTTPKRIGFKWNEEGKYWFYELPKSSDTERVKPKDSRE